MVPSRGAWTRMLSNAHFNFLTIFRRLFWVFFFHVPIPNKQDSKKTNAKSNCSDRSSHLDNEISQWSVWRRRFTFIAVMCSEVKLMHIQMPHKRSQSRPKWRCIEGNYLPWEVSSAICSPLRLGKWRNRRNVGPLAQGLRCNQHIRSIVSCRQIVMRLFKRRKVRIAARRTFGNFPYSWKFLTVKIVTVAGLGREYKWIHKSWSTIMPLLNVIYKSLWISLHWTVWGSLLV